MTKRICEWCGKEFEHYTRKYCSTECAEKGKSLKRKLTECHKRIDRGLQPKEEKQPEEKPRKNTLDDKMAEAKAKGMSYGQLQALKYMESLKKADKKSDYA